MLAIAPLMYSLISILEADASRSFESSMAKRLPEVVATRNWKREASLETARQFLYTKKL